jgi:hypothetical protein
MAAGSTLTIVICSSAVGAVSSSGRPVLCGTDVNGNALYLSTTQAYVIDPSNAPYIDAVSQPFDYLQAAGFWGVAFTTIITLWLVSHGAGAILNSLRRF